MWSYLYVFEQLRLFHLVYPSMVKKAPIVPASNSNILQSSVLCLEGGDCIYSTEMLPSHR